MGDSGKKKRAPRQSKVGFNPLHIEQDTNLVSQALQNSGEATFAAVNPQPSQTPQVKEPDPECAPAPAPSLPSEPSQPIPPNHEGEKASAQPVKAETAPEVKGPTEASPPTKK